MSAYPEPRTPPRFVPTLTEVVDVPAGLLPAQPLPDAPPQLRTELVAEAPPNGLRPDALVAPAWVAPDTPPQPWTAPPLTATPAPSPQAPSADRLDAWAEQITQRVLVQLELRLPTVLNGHAAVFAGHMAAAAADQLRGELPAMVQQAVLDSVAQATWADGDQQQGFQAIRGADADPG